MTEALMRRFESKCGYIGEYCASHGSSTELMRKYSEKWIKQVTFTVKRRKMEYLGCIIRNNEYRLLPLILQGEVDGRRGPGRRKNSWLQNLRQWFGMLSLELFRQAAE